MDQLTAMWDIISVILVVGLLLGIVGAVFIGALRIGWQLAPYLVGVAFIVWFFLQEVNMALCPYCFQNEKEFFSPKCDACNTEVQLGDQIKMSAWSTFVTAVFWLTVIILIGMLFQGLTTVDKSVY